MATELEIVLEPDQIYLSLGNDTNTHRPVFTGDVLDVDGQLVLIMEHPCSMRAGAALVESVLCAPVEQHDPLPGSRSAGRILRPSPVAGYQEHLFV